MERNPASGDEKEAGSIRAVAQVAVVALVIAFHEFFVHEAHQEPHGPARLFGIQLFPAGTLADLAGGKISFRTGFQIK
jgi:hypothetical protein